MREDDAWMRSVLPTLLDRSGAPCPTRGKTARQIRGMLRGSLHMGRHDAYKAVGHAVDGMAVVEA